MCLGFRCYDMDCIHLNRVNDLIPDCPGGSAEDEWHSLELQAGTVTYKCKSKNEISCVKGHSKCFNAFLVCIYDVDKEGVLQTCRDGAHLLDCEWTKCTNTHKCSESYCIPLRKVCDGVADCVNGEDEKDCENYFCHKMLRCLGTKICIHPVDVCDGIVHCPDGDDEMLCSIQRCPSDCLCIGLSAAECRGEHMLYIPPFGNDHLKYLSLGFPQMFVPELTNLSSQSSLLVLDMSNSVVMDICTPFRESCKLYDTLTYLLLQNNRLRQLVSGCFKYLPSLKTLRLEGNPLLFWSHDIFKSTKLSVLNIG